jgi:hypothetical protein
MQGLDSPSRSELLMEDMPSRTVSYNEYVQRRLSESVRKAYVRGFHRGCRRQMLVLCFGVIFGWLAGFYVAVVYQSPSRCRAHISGAEQSNGCAALDSSQARNE